MEELKQTNENSSDWVYNPASIIHLFCNLLPKHNIKTKIVFVRGVYRATGNKLYGDKYYDTLKDKNCQIELTIVVPQTLRSGLNDGNFIKVGGVLGCKYTDNGQIQIQLQVYSVDVIQERVVNEAEMKRVELRQIKASNGYKNVDAIIEQLLYADQRPKIALVLAQTSITLSDFEATIKAAKTAIDFHENRANFANSQELIKVLRSLDESDYTAIAIVRGGGGGLESLDNLDVLETIVNLKTPVISAVGHAEDKVFIKQIADKSVATPSHLGQYFSEMVENVSERKTNSQAAMTDKIKKQYDNQLQFLMTQNKDLQDKNTQLESNLKNAWWRQKKASSDLLIWKIAAAVMLFGLLMILFLK